VKQHDLGEYEENVREKQNIQYIRQKTPTSPQIKPYGWQTPISPANQQTEKNQGVW
jgi:hypothetical protein